MTWIIHQTLFRQNVEIENLPNFNDVKVSWYTVPYNLKFLRLSDFALKIKIRGIKTKYQPWRTKIFKDKYSRQDKNPWNPQKFSPSKILGYTVLHNCCCTKSSDMELKNTLGVKKVQGQLEAAV